MRKGKATKRLWLVRHAEAEPADTCGGSDLERPLTKKGRACAKRLFKRLAANRPVPGAVISSRATRAVQTAEILSAAFKAGAFERTAKLNPGCRFAALRRVALDALAHAEWVVLVGHEPDFSEAAARFTGARPDAFALKKGGVIELELNRDQTGRMTLLLAPEAVEW